MRFVATGGSPGDRKSSWGRGQAGADARAAPRSARRPAGPLHHAAHAFSFALIVPLTLSWSGPIGAAVAGTNITSKDAPGPVSLADLAAIHKALTGPPPGPPVVVNDRAFWNEPERLSGKLVRVQGAVARRFRQPAIGAFPPLAELWLMTDSQNPICVLLPSDPSRDETTGPLVVEGVFLRLIRYPSPDGDRSAPLVVGRTVRPQAAPMLSEAVGASWRAGDWALAGVVALLVAGVIGAQHLRRPPRRFH